MFLDPSLVVQSAVSSFNNAAIVAPTFFWSALLMLPLFALVYFFGNDFINRLSWKDLANPKIRTFNFAFCIEVVILIWLILMHGNYEVLRESTSNLPLIISVILFFTTASIVQKLKVINPPMPSRFQNIKRKKLAVWILFISLSVTAGFAGMPTVFGFLMQFAAVLSGILVGRAWNRVLSPVMFTSFLIFALTTIILMQPEFFRFGQLGSLTVLHKFFVLLVSVLSIAIFAIRNVNPRGKIRHSAFVKLKWMARIVTGLSLILFVLTESVPVFLGLSGVLFVSFAISIWHSESIPDKLSKKLWAALLCSFGIMTSLPLITAFGILYWINLPKSNVIKQTKFLL